MIFQILGLSLSRSILTISFPLFSGYISSLGNKKAVRTWYQDIKKPLLVPPPIGFGLVWTTLYSMMGISKYLMDTAHFPAALNVLPRNLALLYGPIYYLQLFLNLCWCPLFFKNMKWTWAFYDSSLLLGTTCLMDYIWLRILNHSHVLLGRKLITTFLAFYTGWLSFAVFCNGYICYYNDPEDYQQID